MNDCGLITCPACRGTKITSVGSKDCPLCVGKGFVPKTKYDAVMRIRAQIKKRLGNK